MLYLKEKVLRAKMDHPDIVSSCIGRLEQSRMRDHTCVVVDFDMFLSLLHC